MMMFPGSPSWAARRRRKPPPMGADLMLEIFGHLRPQYAGIDHDVEFDFARNIHVPQMALSACMQVCHLFHALAGPILYERPFVLHLGEFLDIPKQRQRMCRYTRQNGKSKLLRRVRVLHLDDPFVDPMIRALVYCEVSRWRTLAKIMFDQDSDYLKGCHRAYRATRSMKLAHELLRIASAVDPFDLFPELRGVVVGSARTCSRHAADGCSIYGLLGRLFGRQAPDHTTIGTISRLLFTGTRGFWCEIGQHWSTPSPYGALYNQPEAHFAIHRHGVVCQHHLSDAFHIGVQMIANTVNRVICGGAAAAPFVASCSIITRSIDSRWHISPRPVSITGIEIYGFFNPPKLHELAQAMSDLGRFWDTDPSPAIGALRQAGFTSLVTADDAIDNELYYKTLQPFVDDLHAMLRVRLTQELGTERVKIGSLADRPPCDCGF